MSVDSRIWASLPVPAVLIGPDDKIEDVNSAAEGFLNASAKAVEGLPAWDLLAVDAPIEEAFERARKNGTPLFVNDVELLLQYFVKY